MSALFWETTQRRLVIPYRHFGTDILSRNVSNKIPRCVLSQRSAVFIQIAAEARNHAK